jgi:hypothetical protein
MTRFDSVRFVGFVFSICQLSGCYFEDFSSSTFGLADLRSFDWTPEGFADSKDVGVGELKKSKFKEGELEEGEMREG